MKRLFAMCFSIITVTILALVGVANAEYPERPVQFIVPWPPGDLEDVLTRLIAEQFQSDYGVPAAVVNIKGGGGVVGASKVAEADADGYMVGSFTGNILTSHIIEKRAPFDQDTFEPLGIFLGIPLIIATRASEPYNNLTELADYAKSNPVKFAHYGFAGPPALQMDKAAEVLGFKFSGSAAFDETNCTLLTNGDADIMVTNVKQSQVCIKSGEAKAIATLTMVRINVFPDVATLDEQVPNVAVPAWNGLFVRSGTPQDVRDKITASAIKALNSDPAKALAASTGAVVKWNDADWSQSFIKQQYNRVKAISGK